MKKKSHTKTKAACETGSLSLRERRQFSLLSIQYALSVWDNALVLIFSPPNARKTFLKFFWKRQCIQKFKWFGKSKLYLSYFLARSSSIHPNILKRRGERSQQWHQQQIFEGKRDIKGKELKEETGSQVTEYGPYINIYCAEHLGSLYGLDKGSSEAFLIRDDYKEPKGREELQKVLQSLRVVGGGGVSLLLQFHSQK